MAVKATKSQDKTRVTSHRVVWRLNGARDGAWQSVRLGATKGHAKQAAALDGWLRDVHGYRMTDDDPRIDEWLGRTRPAAGQGDDEKKSPTVGELVADMAEQPRLAHGTARKYRALIKTLGDLADMPADELTAKHINRWARALTDGGAAESTMRVRLVILKGATKGHTPPEAFKGVRYSPNARDVVPEHLDDEQIAALKATAEPCMRLPVWFIAETGVRVMEMAGLTARHVDLDAGVAHIVQQVRQSDDRKSIGFAPKPLKVRDAVRMPVPLPPALVDALALVRGLDPDEPVFKPTDGGYWSYFDFHKRWRELCEDTEAVPDATRIHDLRHSAAIRMLKRHVPLNVVGDALGHTRYETTAKAYGRFAAAETRAMILGASLNL